MVESNDLFIKYPESISVVYQLAVMAWLMVLAMSDLNPKILLVSQMMMHIAHLYPQYLLISEEWYSNTLHDIRVLFLTVSLYRQIKKWGRIVIPWFGSNQGFNVMVAVHRDIGNVPYSVSLQ